MSDNTTLNSGSGGDIISTDDVGSGVKVQRVKVQYGTDGNATDVSTSNPLPISDAGGTISVDDGGATVSIDDGSGSISVDNPTASSFLGRFEGIDAHNALNTANPVRISGVYSDSPPKVGGDGRNVNLTLDTHGRVLDIHSTSSNDTTNVNSNYAAAQTNTSLVSAPGASKRLVVVEIIYSKDTAGTMKLVEDPAGTPATKFGPHYFPASGGMVASKVYIPLTANKALGITTTGGGNETITARVITENV